jgi:hypothetical protein
MNASFLHTPWRRSSTRARGLMLVALAACAWGLSTGSAQARGGDDVYWSIGVHSPGVAVGVSNAPPPVVVHQSYPYSPRPLYQPRPVVIQHAPVVVHQPYPYPYVRPVVVVPSASAHPGRGHAYGKERRGRGHDKHRHDRHWDDDRRGGHRHR